jgi:hypothetical protein
LIPLDTCAYIFGRKDDTALATQGLELYLKVEENAAICVNHPTLESGGF